MKHTSVMLTEILEMSAPLQSKVVVDVTLGGGGHSLEILKKIENGKLIAFDLDKTAIENFNKQLETESLKKYKDQVELVNQNFAEIDTLQTKADIIIADLGWASYQLESIPGLSYQNEDSELDMRFNSYLQVKASDLLNALGQKELEKLFSSYADLKFFESKTLVKKIIDARKSSPIKTVGDLNNILNKTTKFSANKDKSRIYQALRIAVNAEYDNLKNLIKNGFNNLNGGGKLLIITFHSGEEKIVQNAFNSLVAESKAEYLTQTNKEKYLKPSIEELTNNIRSRSAKLFGIQKI